jgi:hypothetical protein
MSILRHRVDEPRRNSEEYYKAVYKTGDAPGGSSISATIGQLPASTFGKDLRATAVCQPAEHFFQLTLRQKAEFTPVFLGDPFR